MELRQLRYYVAIVDHGSLSRAALVLHVAQPALTQQLRRLEDDLGAQLLHRSAQGVLTTDAGKVFYEHALAILKQVGDARSAVIQSTTRPSGSVTLGLPHSISGALALPLLMAARNTYPEITLQLTEELSGNLNEQLKSGRINLAVLFDDGQLGAFASSALVEEELSFICRTGSAFSPPGERVALADALATTLILPAQQQGVRPRIENVAREAGLQLSHVIEINSIAILKSAILADMGATILPVAPLLADIERGAMLARAIHSPALARTVTLCASRNIPLTNAAGAVKRLVHQVTEELCAGGAWPGARLLK
ncbi:LysR substrate-binding domain-containing protein [Massilia antarctica]|uniref:LysR substrate-binding domain-containing protein n=1 Tax=Massilia antarctica TaxID=2765360 RepID=UPI0006BB5A7C|nr:LysR substrate-binding domain-containing protein [Massilia sp. H27-R4]MCY0911962.1 LysR substrate-binding domain-containing protein [Massilia sp. H27-R4]CUI06579.1 Nitrogen assimilation regulatory protein Nac [Janthinobacterium sp. CG23_2]CUU30365.1 Nitrogen assimilation regulatory protein Nac [Janthinobacterium sp. CG23_2]